jgi:hypothetical protein
MGGCFDHPYHCHRPRQGCKPPPKNEPVDDPQKIVVINIINIIQANPTNPALSPVASGPTNSAPTSGTSNAPKFDAVYLVDLWEPDTFPRTSDEKQWNKRPVAKAIWYYKAADLESMNAGDLPDKEFQIPGDLPRGFDWEAYTIGTSPTAL